MPPGAPWRRSRPAGRPGCVADAQRHSNGHAGAGMTWTNRVIWQEGMFLRAQHFQQQDRWLEALVRGRTAALRPHPLGPDRGRHQPRPAGHRPVRAGKRRRRVRGRHAVFASRARPTSRCRWNCRRPRATRWSIWRCRSARPARWRSPPMTARADATASRLRGLRYPFRLAAAGGDCRSAGCACATCWRPRTAPAITASASRGSPKSAPTGG